MNQLANQATYQITKTARKTPSLPLKKHGKIVKEIVKSWKARLD